jgi:hypothetical protein
MFEIRNNAFFFFLNKLWKEKKITFGQGLREEIILH